MDSRRVWCVVWVSGVASCRCPKIKHTLVNLERLVPSATGHWVAPSPSQHRGCIARWWPVLPHIKVWCTRSAKEMVTVTTTDTACSQPTTPVCDPLTRCCAEVGRSVSCLPRYPAACRHTTRVSERWACTVALRRTSCQRDERGSTRLHNSHSPACARMTAGRYSCRRDDSTLRPPAWKRGTLGLSIR